MYRMDTHERLIVRELIRNPRASDNMIARKTKVSLRTVNRKRKKMENAGYLSYFAYVNNWSPQMEVFTSRKQYIVILKEGITTRGTLEKLTAISTLMQKIAKHVYGSTIAEHQGRVALTFVLESRVESDIIEIFNAEIVPSIREQFGADAIRDVITLDMRAPLRLLHNYAPLTNMARGKLKIEVPDNAIFVTD